MRYRACGVGVETELGSESVGKRDSVNRREQLVAVLVAALLAVATALPSPAWAQQTEAQEISRGGWAAAAGSATWFLIGGPGLGLASAALTPTDRAACELSPRACEPGLGQWALASGVVLLTVGVTAGGGLLGYHASDWLDFDPLWGWRAAGVALGVAGGAFLALSYPHFEPKWLMVTSHVLTVVAGGLLGAWGLGAVASSRGHAWPEFGLGLGGMVAGLFSGAALCGGRPDCIWPGVLSTLGGALGIGAAGLLWGYDPAPVAGEEEGATEAMMMQFGGQF